MRIKLVALFHALLISCISSAQIAEEKAKKDSSFLEGDVFLSNNISLETQAIYGSSILNAQMALDFLFKPNFSAKAKSAFLNNAITRSNSEIDVQTKLRTLINNKWIDAFSINYYNKGYISTSADASKLILFGNKQFAGETVSFGSSSSILYSGFGVDFSKSYNLKSTFELNLTVGAGVVDKISSISANEISLFTESNGEYLDFLFDQFKLLQSNSLLAGVNLNLGAELVAKTTNGQWRVQVKDIMPTFLFDANTLTLDSAFRFEGLEVDVADFKGDGLANSIEEEYTGIYNQNLTEASFVFLPSTIELGYQRYLNHKSIVGATIGLVNFGKYGLTGEAHHRIKLNENLVLQSTLGYGTFRGPYLSEGINWKLNKLQINFEIHGVSSLAAPTKLGTLGSRLALLMPI